MRKRGILYEEFQKHLKLCFCQSQMLYFNSADHGLNSCFKEKILQFNLISSNCCSPGRWRIYLLESLHWGTSKELKNSSFRIWFWNLILSISIRYETQTAFEFHSYFLHINFALFLFPKFLFQCIFIFSTYKRKYYEEIISNKTNIHVKEMRNKENTPFQNLKQLL